MRDRLIELLGCEGNVITANDFETVADYLLENGVIVLPNDIEKLWLISENGLSVKEMILKDKSEQVLRKEDEGK